MAATVPRGRSAGRLRGRPALRTICRRTIVGTAKTCLIDAVACAIFGAALPVVARVAAMIAASGASGPCAVPGFDRRLDPRQAALALGAFAHAFELDSLRKPGAGAHPGATVALPAFAVAQAAGAAAAAT